MKTLIELYDDRAIENILAPDMFRPERVIFLCPTEIAQDRSRQSKIADFFHRRGYDPELHFNEMSLYKADRILAQMESLIRLYPDCALDVTGGTDAALFAGGMLAAKHGTPSFTYSRKKNSFYDISNAAFAEDVPCSLAYSVEEFFLMAGGTMRKGRVDNAILSRYLDRFEPFFHIFLRHQRSWNQVITYIQRISGSDKNTEPSLNVTGRYTVKGEHGAPVSANAAALQDLQDLGFLSDLEILEGEQVSFRFEDLNTRAWLRDVGSVLELYAYKVCLDADIFHDVISSAVVDWDGMQGHATVSNEIDVMAARGIKPLFLSCKACAVKTEAINELAVLRSRFGGKGAKAAMVTTEPCNAAARHRAARLGIAMIDAEELAHDSFVQRLRVLMKAD